MRTRFRVAGLILLFSALAASSLGSEQKADGKSLNWVVAGPFQVTGDNALFQHYLDEAGAGKRVRPGTVAARSSTGLITWQTTNTGPDGQIDFSKLWPGQKRSIAFAYSEIDSPNARLMAATVGVGNNVQLILNGEVVYESRLSRKPEPDKETVVLRLRPGTNSLLAKVEGGQSIWKFQLRTYPYQEKIFVNERATIIPDLRIGGETKAWGQLELANVSDSTLSDVTVGAVGDELVHESRSAALTLAPGQVQRIPFWVAAKTVTPESKAKRIRLRVHSGVLTQQIEFAPRVRKATDYFVTTYRSSVDGSVQPFSVLLPTAYEPSASYPLIVLLHGAHVTDWAQNIIAYEPKDWAIQVAVHDRGNNRYRDIGEVDLDEVLVEVNRRYRIDGERLYLSGHSMGGYGTWFQATRRPDRWAAISSQAGYADYFIYHPAMREGRGNTLQQFQKRLLEHWSPLLFAENLLHVPAYIVHGARDDNVVVEHSRKMAARLSELGYAHVYDENPEGGHWWGPRGANYGTEVVDKPPIWNFLRKHGRRERAPRRVVYTTDTLRYRHAYWVSIDEFDNANRLARIEAELTSANTISVKLSNVTRFTLKLDNGLVRATEPVEVRVDGRLIFHDRLPESSLLTLRREPGGSFQQLLNSVDTRIPRENAMGLPVEALAGELDGAGKVIRYVAPGKEPRLRKTERLYGPVSDAFNTPFLFVTGTSGSEKETGALRRAAQRAAEAVARDWMARADGIVRFKLDTEVTRDDILSTNLILFGNARTNRLIAQINQELPIKFVSDGLAIGEQVKRGLDLGLVMIHPNPLNPERYVVVVGSSTTRGFEAAARLRFAELPDYVVFDRDVFSKEDPMFVEGGFFDKFWKIEGSIDAGTIRRAPRRAAEGSQRQARSPKHLEMRPIFSP